MSNIDIDSNMIIVKYVWASLNILLIIYAVGLLIYAKYFRKSDIQNYVCIFNKEKSFRRPNFFN